jgi:anti-sigma factor (TIGR02949 family)
MTEPQPIPAECLAVLQHLWDYLDDELDDGQTEALLRHIAECQVCREYQLYQESFLKALAAMRERHGAPSVVKSRVLGALEEAGFGSAR